VGYKPLQVQLKSVNIEFPWPGLHNLIQPDAACGCEASLYGAIYT